MRKNGEKNLVWRSGRSGLGYYLRFDFIENDPDSKRKRGALKRVRAFAGANLEEAKYTLARLKKEVRDRMNGETTVEKKADVSLEDFIAEKWDVLTLQKRSNTVASYENSLKKIKEFFRGLKLRAISLELVENFKAKRINRDEVSDATVNRELALLKLVFRKAKDYGFIESDPCAKVEFSKEKPKTMRILSDEEARRLLACASPSIRPLLEVLLTTGLRKNEALALRWSFPCYEASELPISVVDLKKRVLWISSELAKTHESRTILLSPELVSLFLELKKTSKSDRVFPFKTFQKSFVKAKKDAKIGSLRIHDLRHSCASRMIKAGVSIVVVAKILGHSDPKTTMIYCHSEEKDEAVAIEKTSAVYSLRKLDRKKKEILERHLNDTLKESDLISSSVSVH
jgi:integrase